MIIELIWGRPEWVMFNALSELTREEQPRVLFSDRLVLCEAVLWFVEEWLEHHRHGETLSYGELRQNKSVQGE